METMPDKLPSVQSGDGLRPVPLVRAGQRSRADLLAEALIGRIRDERYAPGTFVGTLDGLRTETGHAYSTVSEAVRMLRERGILEIRPGRSGGLFVADPGPLVRLRQTLLEVGDAATSVADVIELREHLEELIDVSAARHRSPQDITVLRAALGRMQSATGWDDFVHANWALHQKIAGICPNDLARAVYLTTLVQLDSTQARLDTNAEPYRRRRTLVHVDLVDAIADGDVARVRRVVRRHNESTA